VLPAAADLMTAVVGNLLVVGYLLHEHAPAPQVKELVIPVLITTSVAVLFTPLALLVWSLLRAPRAILRERLTVAEHERDELTATIARLTSGRSDTYVLMGELLDAAVELVRTFPPHQSPRDMLRPSSRASTWTEDFGALWTRADAELKPQILHHEWERAFGLVPPPQFGMDLSVYDGIVHEWIDGLRGLMEVYARQPGAQLALSDAERLPDLDVDPGSKT
jgi:hypothetical protein